MANLASPPFSPVLVEGKRQRCVQRIWSRNVLQPTQRYIAYSLQVRRFSRRSTWPSVTYKHP